VPSPTNIDDLSNSCGGALTLVQIANNTKGSLDTLQALRYMRSEWQEGEWRSLFVAGIDSANTAQQLDRWIHLNQSIIERLQNEQPSIYTELQAWIADRQNELTRAGAG
jgi:hypothetical protein